MASAVPTSLPESKGLAIPYASFLGKDNSMEHISSQMNQLSLRVTLNHLQTLPQNHNNINFDPAYKPKVEVLIAYDANHIAVKFYVCERYVRAKYTKQQDPVYRDSCVEFFLSHSMDNSNYYNLEFSCIGTILAMVGPKGVPPAQRKPLPKEMLDQIRILSSLGNKPFEEKELKEGECWELTVVIPTICFGLDPHTPKKLHDLDPLSNHSLQLHANSYKCGDELTRPHWISLFPIVTSQPNFHRADAFQPLVLCPPISCS